MILVNEILVTETGLKLVISYNSGVFTKMLVQPGLMEYRQDNLHILRS